MRLPSLGDATWRGFYYQQLRHVFDFFPREQVLVLQFERCAADPVGGDGAHAGGSSGLELPDEPPERLLLAPAGRPRDGRSSSPSCSAELAERYREDSKRLAELCPEIDLSLWPSVSGPSRRAAGAVPQVAAR